MQKSYKNIPKVQTTQTTFSLSSFLMRKFGTASVRVPFQRKRSTSSLHGERRGDGGSIGTSFWTEGHVGVLRLPDPPALCVVRFTIKAGPELRRKPLESRTDGLQEQPSQIQERFFFEVLINFGQFSMSRTWFFYLKPSLTPSQLVCGSLP